MSTIHWDIIGIVLVIIIGLSMILGWSVITYESTEENRPILYGILGLNLIFSLALIGLLYIYNSIIQDNVVQISLVFTFLVALPITLYNLGVTSILYSN